MTEQEKIIETEKVNEETLNAVSGGVNLFESLKRKETDAKAAAGMTTGICPYCHKYSAIMVNGNTLTCGSCGASWTGFF